MKAARCTGATLVFSDSGEENLPYAVFTDSENLAKACDSYENGILDLSKPESYSDLEGVIQQIFTFFKKIRKGGRIIVPESTWCHLPYGIEGMEILMRAAGHLVEMPLAHIPELLISTME